ncbi:hypothetical protein [Marinobacter sp. ATCH36]|uniref:hypothetical protein n=1 Tax=Marinobacter sp. ATCH36 TaxID=2945106 RepID=UPI00202144C6|nr:hypothetical protein [Marinobacter sp. ATCH36]MCL7943692.1 hypothetical protein [Marinobacter sp. ATCH36]
MACALLLPSLCVAQTPEDKEMRWFSIDSLNAGFDKPPEAVKRQTPRESVRSFLELTRQLAAVLRRGEWIDASNLSGRQDAAIEDPSGQNPQAGQPRRNLQIAFRLTQHLRWPDQSAHGVRRHDARGPDPAQLRGVLLGGGDDFIPHTADNHPGLGRRFDRAAFRGRHHDKLSCFVTAQTETGQRVSFFLMTSEPFAGWEAEMNVREKLLGFIRDKHPEWWPTQETHHDAETSPGLREFRHIPTVEYLWLWTLWFD